MPRSTVVIVGVLAWCSPATAQTRIGIRAGTVASSPLVRDSIVESFSVRPDIGPSMGFEISTVLNARYRVGAGLQTTWSQLQRHESGNTDVVPLSAWTPAVTLYRNLGFGLCGYATAGAIIYRADRGTANLFRRGSPPMPLVGAGMTAERPMGTGLLLTVTLGYDVHGFHTPALHDAGFSGERPVHRLGLSVGVSRGL